MKTILIGLLMGMSIYAVAQELSTKPFRLSGSTLKVVDHVEWVYLSYSLNGERKLDSAAVKKGLYTFKGQLSEPVLARLRASYPGDSTGKKRQVNQKRDIAVVFLQPTTITISHIDSFANVAVKGSQAHSAFILLEQQLKLYNEKMEALSNAYAALYKNKDEEGMKKMEPAFDELQAQIRKEYAAYVKANASSPIALYAVNQFAGWDIKPEEVEPLFEVLPARAKSFPSAKLLQEKIEVAKKTGIGQYAMDFTQNDTLGNPVSLSSLRGKYVLIDFWASWCGPCRAENPNVVQAFHKFKEKGFHILGISLDQANGKDKWINAIHDDQLTWTHVSDLQFWKNAVAVQYGIQAIPQNLLIDPEGKIIGKNLRGEELQKKLEALFNKP